MESWFGGGILFAVAAVLWLAYLIPNWLQRREYIASERNAVRLQQTIRVLAETAEAPEAVRLENAAKARIAASKHEQQRVLAEAQAAVGPRAAAAARLRRARLVVALVTLIALVVVGWQAAVGITSGVAASGVIASVAALVTIAGGITLHGMHRTAQERAAKAAASARARRAEEARQAAEVAAASRTERRRVSAPSRTAPSRTWTPQPLPQPLGQVRREAMLAAARDEALGQSARSAAENARIARVAEAREAAAAAESTPAAPVEPRPAAPSRFATMGIVEPASVGAAIDLDSAIARRRAS